MENKGVQCVMVGYSTDHTGDCYDMWDLKTSRIHTTHDVMWLKSMFYMIAVSRDNFGIKPVKDPVVDTTTIAGSMQAGEGDGMHNGPANVSKNDTDNDETILRKMMTITTLKMITIMHQFKDLLKHIVPLILVHMVHHQNLMKQQLWQTIIWVDDHGRSKLSSCMDCIE